MCRGEVTGTKARQVKYWWGRGGDGRVLAAQGQGPETVNHRHYWSRGLLEKVQVLMGDGVRSEKPTAHLSGEERYMDRKFTRQARPEDTDLGASV